MFTIAELKAYATAAVPYKYYANEFGLNSDSNAATVRVYGGLRPNDWSPVRRPMVQFIVRGDPQSGPAVEAKASAIFAHFHNRTNLYVGTTMVSLFSANQPVPIFIGHDENNRPMYSVNFTLTLLDA